MSFASNLNQLRKSRKLTMEQMAKRLNRVVIKY